ncbi:metal-dependent hydrolase [soil metagenome]|jgi:inner membrane protein
MDSLTHIALGACMGEAFAGKTLGKKAMLWGALAQSIPDIDFVSSFWLDTTSALLAHRGFTHSLLFCALITPLFAWAAERLHRPHDIRFKKWLLFFGGVIFIHIFIDAFNNYGVGWFEPFSHLRISFNAIYVADPFFSIWPGIACAALIVTKRKSSRRKKWWQAGLGLSTFYLVYCLFNKSIVNRNVKDILQQQQIHYTQYFTTPAPLQNWLWFVVAGDGQGYHVGYRSVFDSKKEMTFEYFPRNDSLLQPYIQQENVQQLIRFSQQFYTVDKRNDTLLFNDLRFGQVIGWQNPREKFAFHYFLQYPEQNKLVVQRGRFQGWNSQTVEALIKRIKGN